MRLTEPQIAFLRQLIKWTGAATSQELGPIMYRYEDAARQTCMLSARRTEHVVTPRHVSMYLARELTPLSLPTIGRATGGRDHTVVLYAHRKIARLLRADEELAEKVALIRGRFE